MKEMGYMSNVSCIANKNGFIAIYGLLVFQLVIIYCSCVNSYITLYHAVDKLDIHLQAIEIKTIQKVVKDLKEYEEKDEVYTQGDYHVTLSYDDITATITIQKNDEIHLKSSLVYDDFDYFVQSYTYIVDYD